MHTSIQLKLGILEGCIKANLSTNFGAKIFYRVTCFINYMIKFSIIFQTYEAKVRRKSYLKQHGLFYTKGDFTYALCLLLWLDPS